MIDFPDETLVRLLIKERGVYVDNKSQEKLHNTGIIKRKYKLFSSKLETLGIFLFFVADGNWAHCNLNLMIWVRKEEWENKEPMFLNGITYFDLRKTDTLTENEIILKIKDTQNRFLMAATLPAIKYEELKEHMRENMRKPSVFGSRRNQIPIIIEGLLKEDVTEELLKELGLN